MWVQRTSGTPSGGAPCPIETLPEASWERGGRSTTAEREQPRCSQAGDGSRGHGRTQERRSTCCLGEPPGGPTSAGDSLPDRQWSQSLRSEVQLEEKDKQRGPRHRRDKLWPHCHPEPQGLFNQMSRPVLPPWSHHPAQHHQAIPQAHDKSLLNEWNRDKHLLSPVLLRHGANSNTGSHMSTEEPNNTVTVNLGTATVAPFRFTMRPMSPRGTLRQRDTGQPCPHLSHGSRGTWRAPALRITRSPSLHSEFCAGDFCVRKSKCVLGAPCGEARRALLFVAEGDLHRNVSPKLQRAPLSEARCRELRDT